MKNPNPDQDNKMHASIKYEISYDVRIRKIIKCKNSHYPGEHGLYEYEPGSGLCFECYKKSVYDR